MASADPADPDKFGPTNTLTLPTGQMFKIEVRPGPIRTKNDQMASGIKTQIMSIMTKVSDIKKKRRLIYK